MVTSLKEQPLKKAPVYRNIHVSQLASYRLPPAGWVSILHRISGALMFLLLPFMIWMFDTSLTSEISFDEFRSAFVAGIGVVPGWFVKLVAFALIWAYLHALHAPACATCGWTRRHAVGLEFGARCRPGSRSALSSLLTLVARRQALLPVLRRDHDDHFGSKRTRRRRALRPARLARRSASRRSSWRIFTLASRRRCCRRGPLDYDKWVGDLRRTNG